MTETPVDQAWISKAEAMKALNKSERSIDRMVKAGKIERRERPRPPKAPEPIFSRADVEREGAVTGFLISEPEADSRVSPQPPMSRGHGELGALAQMLMAFIAHVQARPERLALPPAPLPQWLGIKASAQYTGLSKQLIRRLIRAGKLPALRDGQTWKIRREDLEALRGASQEEEHSATVAPVARLARVGHGAGNGTGR